MAVRSAGGETLQPDAPSERRRRRVGLGLLATVLIAGLSLGAEAEDDDPTPLPFDADVAAALGEAPEQPAVLVPVSIVGAGQPIEALATDLPAAGQHWVALARAGYPVNAYDARRVVDAAAPGEPLVFAGVTAGQYEIRLYLDWPDGGFTVASRAPVLVSGEPAADRMRASRLAAVLATLPADALNDSLQKQVAATIRYPTADDVAALARALSGEAKAFGDVAAQHESADALAVAIGLAAAAVDLDSNDPDARLILARTYLSAPATVEFHADAEAVLLPLLERFPDDPRPRLLLARIAADMDDFAGVAEMLAPLLQIDLPAPDAAAIAVLVAGGYARAGSALAGIDRLRQALDRDPERAAVRLALAVLLRHAGEADAAAREFQRVADTGASPALRDAASRLVGVGR